MVDFAVLSAFFGIGYGGVDMAGPVNTAVRGTAPGLVTFAGWHDSYGRLVEDRFYVKAAGGGGVSPQELRNVVELFGRQTLAQMETES